MITEQHDSKTEGRGDVLARHERRAKLEREIADCENALAWHSNDHVARDKLPKLRSELSRLHNEGGGESFQARVQPWMMACFGPEISKDLVERNHRFLEESLELVQALGCSRSEAHQLVDYTFDREPGNPDQEAGGVQVTHAALCLANGIDMHEAGERELARIWQKIDKIRAKQAAKPRHSPLPASPSHLPAREAVERAPVQTARNDDEILKILAMAADGPPGDGGANALDSSRAGPRPISSNNRCSWGVALSAIREVVRAAWELCDDTANENPPEVPQTSWDKLAEALERLEQLIPESEQPASAGHVVTLLIAALQPHSQGNGEVVAWRFRYLDENIAGDTDWHTCDRERYEHCRENPARYEVQQLGILPLYAARSSQPEGVREALVTTTICGSTRYPEQHISASGYLTLYEGRVVFLCSMLRVSGVTTEQAERFDLIHKEKIRRSDEILVLDDYVGNSTRSEIEFANSLGKKVRYLSSEPAMAEWVRSNTLSRGLVEAAEWQPIETAPLDRPVDLWANGRWPGCFYLDNRWVKNDRVIKGVPRRYIIENPTHWMPLPAPPRTADCQHEWVDARNEYVLSGEVCLKCHAIRAAKPANAADREGDRDA